MIELMYGDCLERMKEIPDGSIDLVLADPPYGTTACKWDTVIPFAPLWEQLKRVTRPGCAIIMTASQPFSSALVMSNPEWFRYEWIWEKPAATGFFNANKMPLKAHEDVLVFYDKLPTYNPQKTSGHTRKTAGRKEIGSEVYGKGIKKIHYDSTDRYPRSIQRFSKERGSHPTQKPVAWMEYLIKTYTNEGEKVLDFCMGSGTTGVACKKLRRYFVGIEKKKQFYYSGQNRIDAARIGRSA